MIHHIAMTVVSDRDTGGIMEWLLADVPSDITLTSTHVRPTEGGLRFDSGEALLDWLDGDDD